MSAKKIVIFGASGTLGSACLLELEEHGYETAPIGRDLSGLESVGKIDGAVWAQGANFTGSLTETSPQTWSEIWEANFNFIVKSLEVLLRQKSFNKGARLVVISSIWQEISRPQKVAYSASKAAVGGLVRSLAADLGADDIAINAVLPGIVNSPMTRKHLSVKQLERISRDTPGGGLVTPEEVAKTIVFLISSSSHGINGQSIIVDGGWSITRNV